MPRVTAGRTIIVNAEGKGTGRAKTLRDVSRAAGVSLITVSRTLRRPDTVQPATRERVFAAIARIGYVPNLTARSLVSRRSNMVGAIVPILSSSLFADFAEGMATVLQERRIQLLLGVSRRLPELEAEAVGTFIGRQADALIVTGYTHSERCAALLENFAGPVVETWNLRPGAIDLAVGYSNFDAAAAMTRYLIEKGYREIAIVTGTPDNNDQAYDRRAGFFATMAEAGRSVRPEHVMTLPAPSSMADGAHAMAALLNGPIRPDVVFFHAENSAHGALMHCLGEAIRVPEDVAIASIGDLAISGILPVPLTTVRVKAKKMGEESARLVLAALDASEEMPRSVDVGFELMVRRSA